jgi:DNA-binding GntR family transcriptional regulator
MPEQLAAILREEILKEILRPGSKLTEQQISERFEVSRTPVREAIGRLEAEGLVDTIPNRGAFAVGLSSEDAADMFEVRKQYEIIAAKRAAEKATKEDIEIFEERFEFMKHYTEKDDLRKMKQINPTFHEAIYTAARSRLLIVSITKINTYLKLSVHTKDYRRENLTDIFAEHKAIYKAIKNHDEDKAALAMETHCDNMIRRALKKL